jgi:hypothetical protein
MTFHSLGLSTDLLRAIADQGYTKPTPIQQQAIPAILQGQDISPVLKLERAKLQALRCRCYTASAVPTPVRNII